MSEHVRVAVENLRTLARDLFVAAGLPQDWAQAEADVLVWADARGVGSHGVFRIPSYLAGMRKGLRAPDADIRVTQRRGAMAVLDADKGPGLYAMRRAADLAVEIARESVTSFVLVRNMTHSGAMGFYVRKIAEAGMIGITTCASRPLMAYYGSKGPALGTTPIAIATPRANAAPLVFDMASAAISIGALGQARQQGRTLPPDSVLDEDGRVTTDPRHAVTPMPLAGPKGAGLGLMMECLTSLLVASPLLSTAFADPAQMNYYIQNGLIMAVDPSAFGPQSDYESAVDQLARDIKALPRAEGFDEILMPGERGDRQAEKSAKQGILLPATVWMQLRDAAQRLGVSAPEVL